MSGDPSEDPVTGVGEQYEDFRADGMGGAGEADRGGGGAAGVQGDGVGRAGSGDSAGAVPFGGWWLGAVGDLGGCGHYSSSAGRVPMVTDMAPSAAVSGRDRPVVRPV